MSRRDFVRACAGAVAAPQIVHSSVLGLRGATPPNDRITIALVGLGTQMKMHHGIFLGYSETQVVAVCDCEGICLKREQDRGNAHYAKQLGQERYDGVAAYRDFREIVARDDVDAMVIATPNHWHALIAVAALKSGKDVYCEKPLALTIREGRAMVTAARRYGRVFQTGSQQRSSNEFRFACEMVRSGRIGTLEKVVVNVAGPPVDSWHIPGEPVPEALDWNLWLGPAPWRTYNSIFAPGPHFEGYPNWRDYRDYAGGMMTDWGAHHFDIAQWGLGTDDTGPLEITPPNGRDIARLTYRYANGVILEHSGIFDRVGTEFIGTEGRVMVNRGYLETDPSDIMAEATGPNEVNLYRSPGHHQDWIDCIRARKQPICDVEIGHRSASVCHLGNIAYWVKRPLKWDPVQEEFIDDREANRLLQRAMRSPWRISV